VVNPPLAFLFGGPALGALGRIFYYIMPSGFLSIVI